MILALIVTEFPEPRERARAMSVYTFVAVGGGSLGLLAGGVLTQSHQLALDLLHQPPDRRRRRSSSAAILIEENEGTGLDRRRRLARVGPRDRALMVGVYAIVKAAEYGWGSAHTLGFGAMALAMLARSSCSRRGSRTRSCRSASCGYPGSQDRAVRGSGRRAAA